MNKLQTVLCVIKSYEKGKNSNLRFDSILRCDGAIIENLIKHVLAKL